MTTSLAESPARRPSGSRHADTGASAIYLYCAVQFSGAPLSRAPRLTRAPSGLPGLGHPRLVEVDGSLWIVVGDAPLPRYGEAAIALGLRDLAWVSRCAVAHERVVEHWSGAQALVPMKLFTIFATEARALAFIRQRRSKLDRVISRVARRSEWGVRIRMIAPAPERRVQRAASGTKYLTGKKLVRDAAAERALLAQKYAGEVLAALTSKADEVVRHAPLDVGPLQTRLLLEAAFLVANDRVSPFQAVVRRAQRDLKRAGCGLELTGPWPPYNFVES